MSGWSLIYLVQAEVKPNWTCRFQIYLPWRCI